MYDVNRQAGHHLTGKALLVIVGVLLGAALGMYVAALTLPLPHDYTPVYIIKP